MANHDDIADKLCALYKLFIDFSHIKEADISQPPHEQDTLDIQKCKTGGISDDAIALLKKLPWPRNAINHEFHLIRKSQAVMYSDNVNIEPSRHPSHPEDDVTDMPDRFLPAHIITLSFGEYDEGFSIILDADDGRSNAAYHPTGHKTDHSRHRS